MNNLEYFYDIISESIDKKVERLKEIILWKEEILNGKFLLGKNKEWKKLSKEFDSLTSRIKNEIKALEVIIKVMEEN